SAPLANPVLSAQDYSDPTKWQQITALQQDYSNTEAWRRVDLVSHPAQVLAYSQDTAINAGALAISATSEQTIEAIVVAGSAAVGVGTVGVGLSGAGAATENRMGTNVAAFIEGDGATGIDAGSVSVTASDASTINANTGAASLAVSLAGAVAVSVSIGA